MERITTYQRATCTLCMNFHELTMCGAAVQQQRQQVHILWNQINWSPVLLIQFQVFAWREFTSSVVRIRIVRICVERICVERIRVGRERERVSVSYDAVSVVARPTHFQKIIPNKL